MGVVEPPQQDQLEGLATTDRLSKEIRLNSLQATVFKARATHRYRVCASGRRWGKTTEGCTELVVGAAEVPGTYWYVAPTLKSAREIAWDPLRAMIPGSWMDKTPNETRLEVEYAGDVGGAKILLKGADDPDSLRGRGLRGVVIDEYADIKQELWDEALLPALLDKNGWALFLGTPRGFDHFYDLYEQGQNPAFPEWQSWQFKTADAPHISRKKLDEIKRQYEQRGQLRLYYQEFEASFESNAGYILGGLWKPTHTVVAGDRLLLAQGYPLGKILPWHVVDAPSWRPPVASTVFGSVDYGFGSPWSAHLHCALPDGHTRTFFEWYAREVQDVDQARRMRQSIERLMKPRAEGGAGMSKPEWIVLDPAMGGSRKEEGKSKSIKQVYEEELGAPLNIPLIDGAGGRAARLSRPQRWMQALAEAPDGLPWHTITTGCPEMIRTVPRVPWDRDDPEVDDDESENHCIAEGTLVMTRRGEIPIEQVKVGDEARTRVGWQPISRAWCVSTSRPIVTIDSHEGHRLRCTPNHKIWTEAEGWVKAEFLTDGTLLRCCQTAFKNGGANGTTAAAPTSPDSEAHDPSASGLVVCTDTSGRISSDPSRKTATSTIATATEPTTPSATSPVSPQASISNDTEALLRKSSGPHVVRMSGSPTPSGFAPVYDLTVEGGHEFFANGILVHNSYEDGGRFFEARPHLPKMEVEDPYAGLDPLSRQEAEHQANRGRVKGRARGLARA